MPVGQLHHARLGVTAKTVANHKANVAAALRWFGKEYNVPARGVALSAEWATLRDGIGDRGRRARLYGLMRYCSGRGLMPDAVDDAVVADYLRYRAETTSLAAGSMAHRSIARAWNASAGENPAWPAQRLLEPPVKAREAPAWEAFPEGLRRDIDKYLAELGKSPEGVGRQAQPAVRPEGNQDPSCGAGGDGADGGQDRDPHRKSEVAGCSGPSRRRGAGSRRLLEEEWSGAEGLHDRPRLEAAQRGKADGPRPGEHRASRRHPGVPGRIPPRRIDGQESCA